MDADQDLEASIGVKICHMSKNRYTNLKFKNKSIDFSREYRYDGIIRFFSVENLYLVGEIKELVI